MLVFGDSGVSIGNGPADERPVGGADWAMQGLSDRIFENKALMFSAAFIAILVAALLILLIFRLAFGRKLNMSGGRARQPRLGVVDAFDLDRQRQLVIIRRDNVEHLIMIGGPNDIVIESEIVRVEARDGRDLREPRLREKEPVARAVAGPAPTPTPATVPDDLFTPAAIEPGVAPTAALNTPPEPLIVPTAPARTGFSFPLPRRGATPPFPAPPPRAPERPVDAVEPPHLAPEIEVPQKAEPVEPAIRPIPRPAPSPSAGPSQPPAFLRPQGAPKPTNASPSVKPDAPATPVPPKPADVVIESLEEEMAKLLGRGPSSGT
jgi:hypothetical protein